VFTHAQLLDNVLMLSEAVYYSDVVSETNIPVRKKCFY